MGKFNVIVGCFCGWPIGTMVCLQDAGKSDVRAMGMVLGGVLKNSDVIPCQNSKVPLAVEI